jgi:hypothetical protein
MVKKEKKNSNDLIWKLTILEFYLSIYALTGTSGDPPDDDNLDGNNLAYITLIGTADASVGTPAGLVFYGYFFPDGSNLRPPKNDTDEHGKPYVQMDLNISQLAGLVSLLGNTPRCTAQYVVSGEDRTATIIGDHQCP